MEDWNPHEKSFGEMLSKILVEQADTQAFLLTVLDVQARVLARLEARDPDEVVDEISTLLRARRRAALQDVEEWGTGSRTPIGDDEGGVE